MYLDVEQRLAELVEAESPEAVDGRVAQQAFPDLRAWQDPSGRKRWCSVQATEKVDHLGIIRDDQGRLWAQPYLLQAGVAIFSDPAEIIIGRDVQAGFGVTPEPGWKDILRAVRIPEPIVARVERFLEAHPPISWDPPEHQPETEGP